MYTLYFLSSTCSLAKQAILYKQIQPVELIHKGEVGSPLCYLSLVEIHKEDC